MRQWLLAVALTSAACGEMTKAVLPVAGGACRQENVGACETSTRLLICRESRWAVESDCKGAGGCRVSGDTVDCDTRGNSVGDACASAGRVRCDPDGGAQILRCSPSRVLAVEFVCPRNVTQTFCVLGDAGLTCE